MAAENAPRARRLNGAKEATLDGVGLPGVRGDDAHGVTAHDGWHSERQGVGRGLRKRGEPTLADLLLAAELVEFAAELLGDACPWIWPRRLPVRGLLDQFNRAVLACARRQIRG